MIYSMNFHYKLVQIQTSYCESFSFGNKNYVFLETLNSYSLQKVGFMIWVEYFNFLLIHKNYQKLAFSFEGFKTVIVEHLQFLKKVVHRFCFYFDFQNERNRFNEKYFHYFIHLENYLL